MILRRTYILILFTLLFFGSAIGKVMTYSGEICFKANNFTIDGHNTDNYLPLSKIISLLQNTDTESITSINIEGYASPEGKTPYNRTLSSKRALALKRYILKHLDIEEDKIRAEGLGIYWSKLREFAQADTLLSTRHRLIDCIDNIPDSINYATNTSRRKSIMDLGVRTWTYLYRNVFPELRSAKYTIVVDSDEAVVAEKPVLEKTFTFSRDSINTNNIVSTYRCDVREPWLAVKTNLLFDAATALNIELEIPIGNRWSIAAEWIFPWWKNDDGKSGSKRDRFQLLNGNLEGRYWLGNRKERPKMVGWFTGLYAGGGKYDLEHNGKGYQGESFIAAGISAGYAHTLNRKGTLRMEYSLGVGYLQTDYRKYEAYYGADQGWHPVRTDNGRYSWIGPTRAKVSLVWMLHHNVKRGGAK